MSPIYTIPNRWRNSRKTSFMYFWKTGGVGKAIRHHKIFIVAGRSNEAPSRIRTRLYALRRSSLEKMRGPTEFLERGWDQGEADRELDSLGIQSSIIYTWPQTPVLLTHEEKARCHWWTGWPDVILHGLALRDEKWIHSTLGNLYPGSRLIAQPHGQWGGNWVAACLLKTFWNAL